LDTIKKTQNITILVNNCGSFLKCVLFSYSCRMFVVRLVLHQPTRTAARERQRSLRQNALSQCRSGRAGSNFRDCFHRCLLHASARSNRQLFRSSNQHLSGIYTHLLIYFESYKISKMSLNIFLGIFAYCKRNLLSALLMIIIYFFLQFCYLYIATINIMSLVLLTCKY